MIDYINEALFRKDSIKKEWIISGTNINLSNSDLYSESITLEETLSSDSNVFFGNCPASVFKFTTSAISTLFKGKQIHVSLYIDGDYENPFNVGTFIVTDEGVVQFEMLNPLDVNEIVTEYTKMKDFESIMDIFKKMILIVHANVPEGQVRTIIIERVELESENV